MKAKRKVHLSGKWWHPTREFKFFTEKSIGEVIGIVKDQHNPRWLGYRGTLVKLNRKNTNSEQEFSIRIMIGDVNSCFIEGSLQNQHIGTSVHGKTGIINWFVLGFSIVSFLALIVCLLLFGLSALCIGVYPLISSLLYVYMTNAYKSRFYEFVETVNRPKNKKRV